MPDIATAAAAALRSAGGYVLVSGVPTPALGPLVAAAQRHVVSPGPTTRLAVAAGVALGGHRAVTVLEAGCAFSERHDGVAFTESRSAATEALRNGWSVVQPWRGADVAALLEVAPRPAVILLAANPPGAQDGALPPDVPPAGDLRVWRQGELATVLASGPAVGPLVRIAWRLDARGVPLTALEVAVLTSPDLAPLIGGDALFVGGPDAGDGIVRGTWPQSLAQVSLEGAEDADLVGLVLSEIRTS